MITETLVLVNNFLTKNCSTEKSSVSTYQFIFILKLFYLKRLGNVTRWRGQHKGEDNQWFSCPLMNPPAFLSTAAFTANQSADWVRLFKRGGFQMRTTSAGRGQSLKDWQRRSTCEPSRKMRAHSPCRFRGFPLKEGDFGAAARTLI